jgi:superfamily II RNA helicase
MNDQIAKTASKAWQPTIFFCIIIGNFAVQSWSFPLIRFSNRNPRPLYSSTETAVDEILVDEAVELGRSELAKYFDFPLDDWQLRAGGEILMGHNVIVCAPTGSGKTVCGEMALHTAFDRDLDGIYTTPLKALSNQKFAE